jgi:RNA polymerase sigma-70 factor (ECF subfamily)
MLGQGMVHIRSSDDALPSLESWIEAARRGDREALGRALLSFRDYLLLVANEELHPTLAAKGGASDLVQDTFFRAQRGIAEFRGQSRAEWRTWLRMILVRSLAHHQRRYGSTAKRRQGREVMIESVGERAAISPDPSPCHELVRRERSAAVLTAIERLPAHYRDVVTWHHRDKLPFDEIGRRMGVSGEAARKYWARALGLLRRELGAEFGSS